MTALEIAQELVRRPSVNPMHDPASAGEAEVVDWLENWGHAQQLETRRDTVLPGRDNISFTVQNGDGPHLLLNGHTDTVSVAGMSIDPFSGDVRDGRLWGRGASDMKGPLACMLAALLALRTRDDWRGRVTVGCVVDEETEYRGILKLIEDQAPWDYAVVGEPTGLRVVRGCKGSVRLHVRVAVGPPTAAIPARAATQSSAWRPCSRRCRRFSMRKLDDTLARASRRPPVPWA